MSRSFNRKRYNTLSTSVSKLCQTPRWHESDASPLEKEAIESNASKYPSDNDMKENKKVCNKLSEQPAR